MWITRNQGPVTCKVFNENTRITAIATPKCAECGTGRAGRCANVYAYDAIQMLCIQPKNWKDLLTDVRYTLLLKHGLAVVLNPPQFERAFAFGGNRALALGCAPTGTPAVTAATRYPCGNQPHQPVFSRPRRRFSRYHRYADIIHVVLMDGPVCRYRLHAKT